MALKKSELYSSLWENCNELRGGMDSSQYKDYVLVLLFVKYISDRWQGARYSPVRIPKGASFADMVALKGKKTIGDDINKKIIGPIAEANGLSEMPDFNNPDKLGTGDEKIQKLTNLISIFESPALNFKGNRADGDDILGDAYEYLMRNFASESGKSKGQFYTPAEVSRVMAQIIGVENTTAAATVYDPTCGSGSLLLKVALEAPTKIALYGQENDTATAALSKMNMILHDNAAAKIIQGNTLSNPQYKDGDRLKTFDFVVANPPFSYKSWKNGVNIEAETSDGGRFAGYGVPPAKNGDYAFLLHILKSLKSNGKGAVILPHGVLFRGNAEETIRTHLIKNGVIKGIIGLPANLFYGTGIPASIIVLDKENAVNRRGIFIIDASKGFIKDGKKNRLREQDIHKIVDVFNHKKEIDKYSRIIPYTEIESKGFNLNIPRYIDNTPAEDIQNIKAHLAGGIPVSDIDALTHYWDIFPTLRAALFGKSKDKDLCALKIAKDKINQSILAHNEFAAYSKELGTLFAGWKTRQTKNCKALDSTVKPKAFIKTMSEALLKAFADITIIDKYDLYQELMTLWADFIQDDCYLVIDSGWRAKVERIKQVNKKGKETDKGWFCDLIPKVLVVDRLFKAEQKNITDLEAGIESLESELAEIEAEQKTDDGIFDSLGEDDKITKAYLKDLVHSAAESLKDEPDDEDLQMSKKVLDAYIEKTNNLEESKGALKKLEKELDAKLLAKYAVLTEIEVKQLVVDDKWMAAMQKAFGGQVNKIGQNLTRRITELAGRYEDTMPHLVRSVNEWEEKVNGHLAAMGFDAGGK
ncbi:type I restriction-modification system subunit M [Spirochaetia bacterium]|nr:type I restriction-modification system subunit M [Spirochaetia bacterium]